MERLIEEKLVRWKDSDRRKPLMLLGIRQCGKTYAVRKFGRDHYPDVAYFDFESMADPAGIFFKLYYPDVGLLSHEAGLNYDAVSSSDEASSLTRGALAENFVLNELSYALDNEGDFYYWTRGKGSCEVDFQIQVGRDVVPVEVKAGKVNRMTSLKMYCDAYSPKAAFVISKKNVRMGASGEYTFIPLYMVWRFGMYTDHLGLGK